MKKFVSIVVLCLLLSSLGYAQRPGLFSSMKPSKRQIEMENGQLRLRLDSLQRVLDSIRVRQNIEDSLALAAAGGAVVASEDSTEIIEYTPDVSDSLINVWYSLRRRHDYPAGIKLPDLDTVRLHTNVSDTVLMRRLADMNAFITLPFNSTVKNYMILYAEKMPLQMERILGLADYYLPIFEEVFDRYGLPLELKYMAVIESHLKSRAESRVGAKGMWQFMYQTGKAYGLRINSFVDERMDVEKAADAAARYLSDAYRVFGDWNLAICSYNCGLGNVQKAIRRSGSRKFWDLYPFLPRETRGYVPAFVGAMYAMTYYKEYGLVPESSGMPELVDTFQIRRNLHFKQVQEVVGVPVDVLKDLNPQYTHDIVPGGKDVYTLKVPFRYSAAFLAAEDSVYRYQADSLVGKQVLKRIEEAGGGSRIVYKVRSGDTLGRIAQRYHVSVKNLMKWNHLRNSNIRVGQRIYIYK